jgi:hypothetical protein
MITFAKLKTPEGLPRQPDDSVTPDGLVKLAVLCIAEGTGGMSSHYGFVGHYFSMLASPVHGIWDVRGEAAK